jgi:hypothetical protein
VEKRKRIRAAKATLLSIPTKRRLPSARYK